jgi:hypothetical protein
MYFLIRCFSYFYYRKLKIEYFFQLNFSELIIYSERINELCAPQTYPWLDKHFPVVHLVPLLLPIYL